MAPRFQRYRDDESVEGSDFRRCRGGVHRQRARRRWIWPARACHGRRSSGPTPGLAARENLPGAHRRPIRQLLKVRRRCAVICLRHDLGRRRHWRDMARPRCDTHRPLGRLFPGRNWPCPRGRPRWFCRPPRDTGGWVCVATIHFSASAQSLLLFLEFSYLLTDSVRRASRT